MAQTAHPEAPDDASAERLLQSLGAEIEARFTRDEARLQQDEERIAADEDRLAADESELRSNRHLAIVAVAVGAALAVAVAGLVLGLVALNRNIDTVSNAAAKPDSVGNTAIRAGAVTSDKLAAASVTAGAIAKRAVGQTAVARGAVGAAQIAPRAVSGAKVRPNSLTGAQIVERRLGRVPAARAATSAVRAGDALALGGVPAAAYVASVRRAVSVGIIDARRVKGPLAARCPAGKRVVGGGVEVLGADGHAILRGVAIVRSSPAVGGTGWAGVAHAYGRGAAPWRLKVTAICGAGGR